MSELVSSPTDETPPDTVSEIIAERPARRSTRSILEPTAMAIMALGGLMMFQPFALGLYSYSFLVILFGTLMFIVVSHFPE